MRHHSVVLDGSVPQKCKAKAEYKKAIQDMLSGGFTRIQRKVHCEDFMRNARSRRKIQ